MESSPDRLSEERIVALLSSIINDAKFKEDSLCAIPASQKEVELLCRQIYDIRNFIHAISNGDLSSTHETRGFVGGQLKSLVAHLRHFTWLLQNLARGNYIQADPYMGEFSTTFNELNDALCSKSKELSKLIEEYKHLSHVDALTGLLNRHAFLQSAARHIQRALRTGSPLSLILADVDHFKKINDTHGHLCGDAVLKDCARRFVKSLRPNDACCRFGGEEFVVLLAETPLDKALDVAERMREICAAQPVDTGGKAISVTASFGVTAIAHFPAPGSSASDILTCAIHRADRALYKAKKAGRNQVHAYTEKAG